MRVAISAGHSKYVRGAQGHIDEFEETCRVTDEVTRILKEVDGVTVYSFKDMTSHDQQTNLETIVNWHNSLIRDLDISIHFNSNGSSAHGTEAWYVSEAGKKWAAKITPAVADAGDFEDRGPKHTSELYVLNHTEMPCVLIEVCFAVVNASDHELYKANFTEICTAIAEVLAEDAEASDELTPAEQDICKIASNSEIAGFDWPDRGLSPDGYIEGFALSWAQVVQRWYDSDPVVLEMAKADTYDDDTDALSWYRSNFKAVGMSNEHAGLSTLRHLWTLLYSLGMRESSGQHCVGRDQSADNTDSMTCEAGAWQTSANAHDCCMEFDECMAHYEAGVEGHKGYLETFAQDVTCDSSNWKCYGSGFGYNYQLMNKNMPAFAAENCALVLRNLRQHYGPINRKEATIEPEAEEMLAAVQTYVENMVEPEPEPEPEPDDLAERVAALEAENAEQSADLEALQAAVKELDARVTKLEQASAPPAVEASSKKKPANKSEQKTAAKNKKKGAKK